LLRVVLIAVLVILLLRFLVRLTIIVLTALTPPSAMSAEARRRASIALVRCSRCGAYVPRGSARGSGDALLCSACAGG